MAFKIEKTRDYFLLDTRVENMFINEYMISAPGDYVKVYLFALMYAQLGVEFSNDDIAKQLSMAEEDVLKAWTYWDKIGVIRKRNISSQSSLEYDVEFVMLKQMLYGSNEAELVPEIQPVGGSNLSSKEYRAMFSKIEKILGRVISGSETAEIMSWIGDLGTDAQVIEYAFEYCAKRKKTNIKYVSAVIKNWISEGYRTLEEVQIHIGQTEGRGANYTKVFKELGFHRNPTEEEKRIMDNWFDNMSFELDDVLEACKKTTGISNPNINYVNRVLENWYADGNKPKDKDELTTGEKINYLNQLRELEEKEAQKRREEVYSKVPRIRELENEANKLSAGLSRIFVSQDVNKKEQLEKTRNAIDMLTMERAMLLTDNNFELDYMEVKYNCPHCKDTGLLETGERCQCLNEITKEKINLLAKRIG
ncbi:MAG: DnaD domain protein [Bacillota bacterium]|nr:DnaD domain protein [Bacillota bacterium]